VKTRAEKSKWILAVAALVVLITGSLAVRFRLYGYAIMWHCVHGSYAQISGYKIKLPIWWWEERDPDRYDSCLLLRASGGTLLRGKIDISPAIPSAMYESDDAQRKAVEDSIAQANHYASSGRPLALVVIKTKKAELYCQKLDSTLSNSSSYLNLNCTSASSKYVFSYSGLSRWQSEAVAVLSGLE
jgi:hypothetical protein